MCQQTRWLALLTSRELRGPDMALTESVRSGLAVALGIRKWRC